MHPLRSRSTHVAAAEVHALGSLPAAPPMEASTALSTALPRSFPHPFKLACFVRFKESGVD